MSSRSIKDIPPQLDKTSEHLDMLSYSFRSLSKVFNEIKENAPEEEIEDEC